ncbi:MAG: Ig-like domain-containing protein [Solirubrobacterales bacterium]
MSLSPRKAALRVALSLTVLLLLPAAADAATWTVDDDGAQCPNASFSSIQTAVDYAAPHDTIVICDGIYQEKSTPLNGTSSPAQPGSRNGLTITKPLTLKGAGASKVFIEPDPVLGDSLAGTVPYLRDGGGNVVTIARQSLGASDDNENQTDISGVTIRSPYAYAEAGVAYFNTSGTISKSTIGPLRRANADETTSRPYGWGVIETNFLQGTGGGSGTVRRQVSVVDSLVTGYQAGGVLFDGARGADGSTESAARAGITQYGYVTNSKIVGGASGFALPQTGVKYFAGTRGAVTGSTIQDNSAFQTTPTVYNSYGIFLQDSENGQDPDNTDVRGLLVNGNTFINNRWALYNADLAGTAVRVGAPVAAGDNYWGCSLGPNVGSASTTSPSSASFGCQGVSGNDTTPAASVELPNFRSAVPATLNVPLATPDAAPTAKFVDPEDDSEAEVGDAFYPVVVATDDFGVKSVALSAGGTPVATLTKAPYEFEWSPAEADAGKTITLKATVTDSAGQTTTDTVHIEVAALPVDPPVLKPPVNAAAPVVIGDPTVGASSTCLVGVWNEAPTSYSYQWLLAGSPISGATAASYTPVDGDTASELSCLVTATNGDGSAAATSAGKLVKFPPATTTTVIERQVGSVIVSIDRQVKVSTKTGKATIGEATCARAAASVCKISLNGSVKIGAKSYALAKVTLSGDGANDLSLVLPSAARKALAKKSGTLSFSISATDDTGFYGSWKGSIKIKKK